MIEIERDYEDFVLWLVDHKTTQPEGRLLHMVLGIVTEAGELADSIKQVVGYNQDIDYNNVEEELGDLLFYLTGATKTIGLSLDDIRNSNMTKLTKRYPDGYTDEAALARKDKK